MTHSTRLLGVLHVISGDLWAGAESQAYTLLKHLQPECNLHVVLLNDGELAGRLRLLNIPITLLSERSMSSASILREMILLIRQLKPEIIHTHRQKENILGGLANFFAFPSGSGRAKSLRTTHGASEFQPSVKQKLQVWLDRFVGNNLQHAVIAVSEDLAKKLTGVFPTKKIHVIHNGVDGDTLYATASIADFKKANPNDSHIGIVGRLESVKRIDIFIHAASILFSHLRDVPPIKFHIIGDGRLRAKMEDLAISLGVEQAVQFHGHRSDMAACISSLDVLVMCSDHEGTPMVALEALALGTRMVAHDVGGLHELLIEQPEFLVQVHKPEAYAEKIRNFLQKECPAPFLPSRYTAQTNAASVLALYSKLRGVALADK